AHGYGIPLIADSAHGAHLPISKRADVTVVSLHKTLPAMTQVSAVLLNGDLVDPEDIKRYINIYQTTSPSYVLMASAEKCLDIMENEGEKRKADLKERINRLYDLNRRLRRLWLTGPEFKGKYGINDFDMSRINLFDRTGRTDGKGLYDILRKEYRLQPEKHTGNTCLLISGIMDTEEGFRRLEDAILSIDRK
nr:decarboxylase [Lachnospiraceae bacterium]